MRGRRKLPPDKRLDWRDQNMPVLAIGRKANRPNDSMVLQEVKPELVQQFYKWSIDQPNEMKQHWSDDPSYFWSRKK